VFGEAKLNNADWPEAMNALRTVQWPDRPGLLVFKQFFLLHRQPERPVSPRQGFGTASREQVAWLAILTGLLAVVLWLMLHR
jgi:hypothetical protein